MDDAGASTTVLGDWYANILFSRPQQLLLCVSSLFHEKFRAACPGFAAIAQAREPARADLFARQRVHRHLDRHGRADDIARDTNGVFYICEQEADGNPAYICVRDGEDKVLAKWETRHAHGLTVDAHGDIYVGLTTNHNVDKYVLKEAA